MSTSTTAETSARSNSENITEACKTSQACAWLPVCAEQELVDNSGICSLLENKQIAIFTLRDKTGLRLFACDNYDPFGKANVLSRGILCSIGDEVCICSPLYKQHFSLSSGICLEQEEVSIPVFDVKIEQGTVFVAVPVSAD
ncbi:MAG: nitrite reductase small subunit NirD [Glaciecola sp.]